MHPPEDPLSQRDVKTARLVQNDRMVRFELLFGLMVMGLWIYCLVEVIGSRDDAVRNLPKLGWLLVVLLFPLAGSVAWLVVGRPRGIARSSAHAREVPSFPEYDRPGRAAALSPEDDEAFLRRVRERAEEQRRAYREGLREREREEHEKLQRRLRRDDDQQPEPDPGTGP